MLSKVYFRQSAIQSYRANTGGGGYQVTNGGESAVKVDEDEFDPVSDCEENEEDDAEEDDVQAIKMGQEAESGLGSFWRQ